MMPKPEQDSKRFSDPASNVTSQANEGDEGRHRTHELYSKGPQADGLYHCPFKATDANCPHVATKLKCNYEYELQP